MFVMSQRLFLTRTPPRLIEEALACGGRVLVHCKEGISRSATIVVAHLMQTGVPMLEALAHVKKRRSVFPNDGFLRQLAAFELQLRTVSDADSAAEGVEIVQS